MVGGEVILPMWEATHFRVVVPPGAAPPEPMIELYDSGLRRVDLEEMYFPDLAHDHISCLHDELVYFISHLPNGEYTFVHRESLVPLGLEPFAEETWTFFEGERALVATVILNR